MRCPYCRYPLEALSIAGRPTGVWQCLHCKGAWLKASQHGGVAGLLPGAVGAPPSRLPVPMAQAGAYPGAYPGAFPGAGNAPYGQMPPGAGFEGGQAHRPIQNPWQSTGNESPGARPKESWWKWFGGGDATPKPPPLNPDWDICTWCGKTAPGPGLQCQHCKVERMRCPECQSVLVGARRHAVMVDLCLRCQGIWFEKGRLEALMNAVRGTPEKAVEGPPQNASPSLLVQLASFLESTERSSLAEPGREEVGLWDALSSTFSSGVGGSKQILYDLLTLVGDLQGNQKPPSGQGKDPRRRS